MYGESQVRDTFNQGRNSLNEFDPQGVANSTRASFDNLNRTQTGQTNDYLTGFRNQIASQPSALDYYDQGNDKYNVPQLQQKANYLNSQVVNQLPMQYQLAKGWDVSDSQVQNATNQALRFLLPASQSATAQAQTAQGLAEGYSQAGQIKNQYELQPTITQGQMLQDSFARQMTGFSTEAQQRYEGLLQKAQLGVQLSSAEADEYAKLASAQQQYNAAIEGAKIGAQNNIDVANLGNKYKIIPAGQTLVNTLTGASKRAY